MKSLTEHLWFEAPNRRGFINIIPKIEELVHRSGVMEGLYLVNAMHITASLFINDDWSFRCGALLQTRCPLLQAAQPVSPCSMSATVPRPPGNFGQLPKYPKMRFPH
jgi:hypothetical protein